MSKRAGAALVVEDNMIIAMDADDILRDLGFSECHICSTVQSALDILSQQRVIFALLDINLGEETSEAVAIRLHEQSTPFAFASGYENLPAMRPALASAPVVTKPYTADDIATALVTLGL